MMTPNEVCKQLNISPSTLRKYSLRFESEEILFKRNKNNSRIYTVTEVVVLRESITVTKSGDVTVENVVREAAEGLKGASAITPENGVTSTPPRRHDAVATARLLVRRSPRRDEAQIGSNRRAPAATSCTITRGIQYRCPGIVLTGGRKRP